jgi:cystathionine beta-lyase/cystathionine gamma-synthase
MKSVYGGTRQFLQDWLPRFGVETSFVAGDDPEEFFQAATERTRVFYLESPSTFLFKIIDLPAITAGARERGITTMLDNSWATPVFQRPAEVGVDLVLHSASKYLGGHSDIVAGVVAGSAAHLQKMVMEERMLLGGSMDPHQAWLLTRGLRTLPLRMQRHQESGLEIARRLAEHPKVADVLHPGLPASPYHERAREQLDGYAGLFSILLKASADAVHAGLERLEVFRYGPSWGGFESLIVAPFLEADEALRNSLGMPAGLVRLSVGLEDPEWLLEDLRRFLDSLEG